MSCPGSSNIYTISTFYFSTFYTFSLLYTFLHLPIIYTFLHLPILYTFLHLSILYTFYLCTLLIFETHIIFGHMSSFKHRLSSNTYHFQTLLIFKYLQIHVNFSGCNLFLYFSLFCIKLLSIFTIHQYTLFITIHCSLPFIVHCNSSFITIHCSSTFNVHRYSLFLALKVHRHSLFLASLCSSYFSVQVNTGSCTQALLWGSIRPLFIPYPIV